MKRNENCTKCNLCENAQYVCLLGDGPYPNDVAFISEAPGERENNSGKPFVGRAGRLLERIMVDYGFTRENTFITNAVSCRPEGNATPTPKQVKACKEWLDYQFSFVKPKYVLLLGATALLSVLGKKLSITKARGKPFEQNGIIYLPTFHPAYLLKNEAAEPIFRADLRLFSEIVEQGEIPRERGLNYTIVNDQKTLTKCLADLKGLVSFDIETTGLYPWAKEGAVTAIGFGTKSNQWLIPFNISGSNWSLDAQQDIVKKIDKRLGQCTLVMHNGKFDAVWMKVHYDVLWKPDFDTMLAHYMLDENARHGLKSLTQIYLNAPDYDIDADIKKGNFTYNDLAEYHALDVYYTRKLYFIFMKELRRDPQTKKLFDKLMMPCSHLFIDVEVRGVYVDVKGFDKAEAYLREEKQKAEDILAKYSTDVNWRSPAQLATLLYDELNIPIIDRTAKGAPSTNESVLKRIDHPIAHALLKYRGHDQQLKMFIDGWKPFLDGSRLHPSFKLHGTVTGRLSCENPNLQQVPRDPRIRSLITAPPGWVLIEADLSQIELRVAAELAGENTMIHAFMTGVDIHWLTAIREIARGAGLADLVLSTAKALTGKKLNYSNSIEELLKAGPNACQKINSAWKEHRKKAKAINFGYLYGMWWKKFKMYARDNYGVDVTDQQAEQSRKAYFELYHRLPAWHKNQKTFARDHGFVRSLNGRKRRLPAAAHSLNQFEQQEAERQAINSPVQSFANDLNLMAALQLYEEFGPSKLNIIGTVHDAILFEVKEKYVEEIYNRILEVMAHPKLLDEFNINLSVPIEAEAEIGAWGQGKDLKTWLNG